MGEFADDANERAMNQVNELWEFEEEGYPITQESYDNGIIDELGCDLYTEKDFNIPRGGRFVPVATRKVFEKDRESRGMGKLVMVRLKHLNPYVYKVAASGSVYIKFREQNIRSLRIGNHAGRQKYAYKWNLRKDREESSEEMDRGAKRFYYPWDEWEEMCVHIENYAAAIKRNQQG